MKGMVIVVKSCYGVVLFRKGSLVALYYFRRLLLIGFFLLRFVCILEFQLLGKVSFPEFLKLRHSSQNSNVLGIGIINSTLIQTDWLYLVELELLFVQNFNTLNTGISSFLFLTVLRYFCKQVNHPFYFLFSTDPIYLYYFFTFRRLLTILLFFYIFISGSVFTYTICFNVNDLSKH